jgi:F-type H+-transporting ATPase subunit b
MLAAAQEQVQQFEADAKAKLEESLARRQKLSEQRIKVAEVRAEAEVRAAAADLATKMAEQVLMQRIAGAKSDPLIDKAISQLAGKLQ